MKYEHRKWTIISNGVWFCSSSSLKTVSTERINKLTLNECKFFRIKIYARISTIRTMKFSEIIFKFWNNILNSMNHWSVKYQFSNPCTRICLVWVFIKPEGTRIRYLQYLVYGCHFRTKWAVSTKNTSSST